jgi:hypothetical protein
MRYRIVLRELFPIVLSLPNGVGKLLTRSFMVINGAVLRSSALLPQLSPACAMLSISMLLCSNAALAVSASFAHPDPQAIQVVVEPNPAFEDEDVTIRLISSGRHTQLNMGRLGDDFETLGRRGSSQTKIVNGRSQSTYETILIVRPKRSGKLTIPRMQLNGKTTEPVVLEVKPRPKAAGKTEEIFLATDVQPSTAYVGQQVMIRQQLHARSNITSGELSTPTVANAVMERIGEDRRFTAIVDGVRYNVIERVYAAFPESAGSVMVDGGRFSGEVDTGGAGFGMFRNTRRVQAAAARTELTVNPPPTAARGHWLPASAIKASVELVPADAELRVGEPVTLKFQIVADGILGSALPEITLQESDKYSAYVEPGTHETQGSATGVSGKRELLVALIPLLDGKLTFPAVEIPWWDVINDKQQVTRIDQLVFDVLPSADAKFAPIDPAALPPTSNPGIAAVSVPSIAPREILAWTLVGLLVLIWVLTLLLLRRRPSVNATADPKAAARSPVSLYEVNKALKSNDVAAATTALCDWASAQLDQSIVSLPEAAKELACLAEDKDNGQEIAKLLLALDASRFGGDQAADREGLLVACQKWRKKKPKNSTAKQQLPGLYSRG